MAEKFSQSHYSTLIIGAGLQGLACARTFVRLDPSSDLLVLDANQSIGGVWARERLYPGLQTNNQVGTFQYTDFPLLEAGLDEKHGLKDGAYIPGEAVHDYLTAFAQKEGLTSRIRLGCRVTSAEETDVEEDGRTKTGWRLEVLASNARVTLTCAVLIISTGACTTPTQIDFPGQSSFDRPRLDFASLGTTGLSLVRDPNVKHVTVCGTSKSAYDCVYMFASAGKQVSWIIRKSGHGARYMTSSFVNLGPFRKRLEWLIMTRPVTLFSPCVFGDQDGYGWIRRFLHGTSAGNWIVKNFFASMTQEAIIGSRLDVKDERMKALLPRDSVFWHATQSGILNYPTDFYDLIRVGTVDVVEEDIASLGPSGIVTLASGSTIKTDAIIIAAGWQFAPTIKLLPESKHAVWGVPSISHTTTQSKVWAQRHADVDAELLARFPMLSTPPPSVLAANASGGGTRPCYTPFRLYRAIAPPVQAASSAVGTRNLVFLGAFQNFQGTLRAELSALWAYAYVHHRLQQDPGRLGGEEVYHDAALLGRWCALRHPFGMGKDMPDIMLDGLAYFDLLCNDLGLRRRRGLLGDLFGGHYEYAEWKGIIEEWQEATNLETKDKAT